MAARGEARGLHKSSAAISRPAAGARGPRVPLEGGGPGEEADPAEEPGRGGPGARPGRGGVPGGRGGGGGGDAGTTKAIHAAARATPAGRTPATDARRIRRDVEAGSLRGNPRDTATADWAAIAHPRIWRSAPKTRTVTLPTGKVARRNAAARDRRRDPNARPIDARKNRRRARARIVSTVRPRGAKGIVTGPLMPPARLKGLRPRLVSPVNL